MAKYLIYNADGSVASSTDTSPSGGSSAKYNRVDVGPGLWNGSASASFNGDMHVPGTTAAQPFRRYFSKPGWVLGASIYGTTTTNCPVSPVVGKYTAQTSSYADILDQTTPGALVTWPSGTGAPGAASVVMLTTPVAFVAGDYCTIKIYANPPSNTTLDMWGFVFIGETPV